MSISIAMCTYNGANYLDEQLHSIINQTSPAAEIIIVDDASTDDTYSILLEWQNRNDSIKIYRNKENLGYNHNFAKAITLTTGDYISISDQDDIWLPEKNELLAAALDKSPVYVLAHCRSARLENGKVQYLAAKRNTIFDANDTRKLIFNNQISGHNMMFRRSLLPFILPIPTKMFYDWWIAVVATTQGSITAVNLPLVEHRIHQENAYYTKSRKNEPDRDEIIENFLSISHLSPETRVFTQELYNRIKTQIQKEAPLNFSLLKFLFKHREIIFGHNKKKIPIISHLKRSIKYARSKYRHMGVN